MSKFLYKKWNKKVYCMIVMRLGEFKASVCCQCILEFLLEHCLACVVGQFEEVEASGGGGQSVSGTSPATYGQQILHHTHH